MSDDGLAAFLRARLDEDEVAAKAAPGRTWRSFTGDDVAGASVYDEQWVLLYPARYDHDNPLSAKPGATGPQYIQRSRDELAAHVARQDPARVLREVDAKRMIVDAYVRTDGSSPRDRERGRWDSLHAVMRHLVAVYRDHPDYRREWGLTGP